jgi:hypothetical protein
MSHASAMVPVGMGQALRSTLRNIRSRWLLPAAARAEARRDRAGLPPDDPGTDLVLPALLGWMSRAQDRSKFGDGGVARDFSLIHGWASSYPETTGYIIPTFLSMARRTGNADLRARALRMTDWLVALQLDSGAFQGGKVDSRPVVAVTFNTGQILLGLTAAQAETGRYLEPMRRAADWLVQTQDADGCWRKHQSPFAAYGDKEYETHVAWGLFEAARLVPNRGYAEAGLANIRWALSSVASNGWFARCCLDNPAQPLTHTLGYALRGVLEAWRFQEDPVFLEAAQRTADGLMGAMRPDGFLPGRLGADWSAAADWACLTGTAQVAYCWLLLHQLTGRADYLHAGSTACSYVRRTVRLDGPFDTRGAVKGSFPVDGEYGRFEYLNWAAKFLADVLMLERDIHGTGARPVPAT